MLDHPQVAGAQDARTKYELVNRQFRQFFAERDFQRALESARQARTLSSLPEIAHSEALCLQRLGQSREAYEIARNNPAKVDDLNYRDMMAEICGTLGRGSETRGYGEAALRIRDRQSSGLDKFPIPDTEPPSTDNGGKFIAFSLFGASPRYCEFAVMNCVAANVYLPDWTCRFYCDESVPVDVRRRIGEAGGEVSIVDEETRASIPPGMWRFLVADDHSVSRFLSRDADTLIGPREAAAVDAWLKSGKWFHVMRDHYSHTDLMFAGLWGGCTGVIPDMRHEIAQFLRTEQYDQIHVDRHFLRVRIWPTARQSILSHDSQFEF